MPGYPVTLLLALVPILIVIVLQTLRDPRRAGIGLSVVVLGVPVSAWVLSRRQPADEGEFMPTESGEQSSCVIRIITNP